MIEGIKFTVADVMAVGRFRERAKRNRNGYLVRCPAHDDSEASCSVMPGENGFATVKCFTGCDNDAIHRAFISSGVVNRWEEKTERKPAEPAREVGRRDFVICDAEGDPILLHRRIDFAKRQGEKKGRKEFRTLLPNGAPIPPAGKPGHVALADVLFGLERLKQFPDRVVVICEGEKAAIAARELGINCALGTVGASVRPSPALVQKFKDRAVIFWRDADEPGLKQAETFREALRGVVERFGIFVNPDAAEGSGDDAYDFSVNGHDLDDFNAIETEWEIRPAWPNDVAPLYSVMKRAAVRLDRYRSGDLTGIIETGYRSVDRAIRGGLEAGEVYLLGAPTGGGKTTIMQDFAERIAKLGPVLFVTPEMTAESMAIRAIMRKAGRSMDEAAPWQDDQEAAAEAFREMVNTALPKIVSEQLPILLFDKPDATMAEIEDRASRVPGLKALVIDYAQQVASLESRQPRYLQVGEVATRSTVIAKTLGVPVLLASQVNRTFGEGKSKGTPSYSFRETAMLEHKASVVLIFDRALDADGKPMGELTNGELPAVLSCQKNRLGPMFKPINMRWRAGTFTVRQADYQESQEQELLRKRRPATELVAAGTPPPALPPAQGRLPGEDDE